MGVRKPLEKSKEELKGEVDVSALINQGAKVKEDLKKEIKDWTVINLRISTEMLQEVDEAVKNRVGITRTGWILEAIHKHLRE